MRKKLTEQELIHLVYQKKSDEKVTIKSDEIKEILGKPPRWVIRWGITVIFIIIGIIIISSNFFIYPDIVVAPVVITAENPPSVVISRASGKPDKMFVIDGQRVTRSDTLAVIENPANYNDVFELSGMLSYFTSGALPKESLLTDFQAKNRILGELQPEYNAFSKAYFDYLMFKKQEHYQKKIEALKIELKQTRYLYDVLWRQRNLALQDLKIIQLQFSRDSTLFEKNLISAAKHEQSKAEVLKKEQALENIRIKLADAAITISYLKYTIDNTQLELEMQREMLIKELLNASRQLASSLSLWEKYYLLKAPTTGKLSFLKVWSNVQEVKEGDALFSITPDNIGEVQARMIIPFEGAGKVKKGQVVNIKLDGYSYLEFGMVEGILQSVSSGYTEQGYPALAVLTKGPVTSYGVEIPTDRELPGRAEIITEDLSLLQRIISPLKHIYKSRIEK